MAAAIASLMLNKDKVGIYKNIFLSIDIYLPSHFVNSEITLYLLQFRPMHDSL